MIMKIIRVKNTKKKDSKNSTSNTRNVYRNNNRQ